MMEQATSMKDILSIQSQITDVRYEIESYESQLRVYDNQVTYSTVYLDLYEVNRESSTTGTTFGERGTGISEFYGWITGRSANIAPDRCHLCGGCRSASQNLEKEKK